LEKSDLLNVEKVEGAEIPLEMKTKKSRLMDIYGFVKTV
jgi:hypothetical protein